MTTDGSSSLGECETELRSCDMCSHTPGVTKRLQCLHEFCESCITGFYNMKKQQQGPGATPVACPVCCIPVIRDENYIMKDMLCKATQMVRQEVSDGKSICAYDDQPLEYFCVTCQKYACANCPCTDEAACSLTQLDGGEASDINASVLATVQDSLKRLTLTVSNSEQNVQKSLDAKENHRTEAKAKVSSFYRQLRDEISEYLEAQEKEKLLDVDHIFDRELNRYQEELAGFHSLAKKCQLLENISALPEMKQVHKTSHQLLLEMLQTANDADYVISDINRPKDSAELVDIVPDNNKKEEILSCSFMEVKVVGGEAPHEGQNTSVFHGVNNSANVVTSGVPAPVENTNTRAPYTDLVHRGGFRSLLPDDKERGCAVALKMLDHRILVVDRWNSKLKLFTLDGKLLKAMAFLGNSEPWDADVVPSDEAQAPDSQMPRFCFVATPNARGILRVMIPTDGKMSINSRVATREGYCCVAYCPSGQHLACGVCAPFGLPRVDVINLSGVVMTSHALDSMSRPLFVYPRSISVDSQGTLAVCDWKNRRVVFIRNDGLILNYYTGSQEEIMREPFGTAVDKNGIVYISDKYHKIHLARMDGSHVGVIQTSKFLREPREICIDSSQRYISPLLIVSHGSGDVSVFDLVREQAL